MQGSSGPISPMWHRSEMASGHVSSKETACIQIFSDQFQASFTCGNKSDMDMHFHFTDRIVPVNTMVGGDLQHFLLISS